VISGGPVLQHLIVPILHLGDFFELNLSTWDIAAGSLLITEAGGIITDFGGGGDYLTSGNIVAGNAHIHDMLLTIIKDVFQGAVEK
jgi:myo-inositol-1(or 4)-monophosphatase